MAHNIPARKDLNNTIQKDSRMIISPLGKVSETQKPSSPVFKKSKQQEVSEEATKAPSRMKETNPSQKQTQILSTRSRRVP